jgi:hypothetical protein
LKPPSPLRGLDGPGGTSPKPGENGFRTNGGRGPRGSRGRSFDHRASRACRASSSDFQSRPLANHIITASGCFAWSCFSVGSSSSCVAARNEVGWFPKMIVQ